MKRYWLLFSQWVTVLLALWFVVATLQPDWLRSAKRSADGMTLLQAPVGSFAGRPAGSLSAPARLASPAVVSIKTSQSSSRSSGQDPWFKFFHGEQEEQSPSGLGSGVIVSPEGHILTNNHVIEDADGIEVALADGRRASAQVIGTDPDTDLALLKIDLDKLPVIVLGTHQDLQVGDVVLAIGNPFGVGQTVTSGIVSALGRAAGIAEYEDFIQTDAAINPGNSGGALVDMQGRLVGVNTAIFSKSGGSIGIGFAIPVNMVKIVVAAAKGGVRQVRRPWLGATLQPVSREIADSLGMDRPAGALVSDVIARGPAEDAGLQRGDVILAINDQRMARTADLRAATANRQMYWKLTLLRGGQVITTVLGG